MGSRCARIWPRTQRRDLGHLASGLRLLFGVARIVGGIDVFELDGTLAVEDDGGFLGAGISEVVHVGRHEGEAAGGEGFVAGGRSVKLVAHAERDRAGNDDNMFVGGMGVRGDRVVGRKLETHGVGASSHGVASEYSDLRSGREQWWGGSPFRLVEGCDDVFLALSLEDVARCARQNRGYCDGLHEGFQGCLLRVLPCAHQYYITQVG